MTYDSEGSEKERRQDVWVSRFALGFVAAPAVGMWILVAWLFSRILFGQAPATIGAFLAPAGFAFFAVVLTLLAYVPLARHSRFK